MDNVSCPFQSHYISDDTSIIANHLPRLSINHLPLVSFARLPEIIPGSQSLSEGKWLIKPTTKKSTIFNCLLFPVLLQHTFSFGRWTRTRPSIKICSPTIQIGHGTVSHGIPVAGVGRGTERREGRLMCNTLKAEGSPSCFVKGPADMGKHLLRRNRDWWLKLYAATGSASKNGESNGRECGCAASPPSRAPKGMSSKLKM